LENGTLIPPPNDSYLVDTAEKNEVIPMMVITNFRGATFDSKLANVVLNDMGTQQALIENIISTMVRKGFTALNVDFERIPNEDRDLYTGFIAKLKNVLGARGYLLSVALAPKTSGSQVGVWYEAHDYGAMGTLADFVILMTYEWGWSGGPPLPVAPINEVKRVLDYAVTVIPREKIMIGMPLYGYDWVLPYSPRRGFAKSLSPIEAIDQARKVGAKIEYDKVAESPFYNYYDNQGTQHVVWFEDARSVYAKFLLVKRYNLLGVSYWVLGRKFPQNWILLDQLFNISK
jgi:spore germination protein